MNHQHFDLKGKVIVITGAAGLLGRMHAKAVCEYGGTPILLDLASDKVEHFSNDLNKTYGTDAMGLKVDITDEVEIEASVDQIITKYRKIDALINNAANNPKVESTSGRNFSRLENFPIGLWEQDISVGLTGAFICAKYFGSQIAQNPNGGCIINIASDLGIIAPDQRLYSSPSQPAEDQKVKPVTYSVVKSGLIGLTRYLATYWPEQNVRCNAICPGGVENGQAPEFIQQVSSLIPLNRMARSDEFQSTLIWMLGDGAAYLNGAVIPVDGGRTTW